MDNPEGSTHSTLQGSSLPQSLASLTDPEAQIRALAEHIVNTSRVTASSVGGSSVTSVENNGRRVLFPSVPLGQSQIRPSMHPQQHLQQQQAGMIGHHGRQIPIMVSDDIVSGAKRNGWMSPVRRFFCLLVTFDLLLTALLWIITVIVTGKDIRTAIRQQTLEYTIHDSMFDCVLAAVGRFLLCILFYAAFDLSHWWPIAVTTTGTVAFVVAKVFEYQWTKFGPITFDVMLVLLSFILSWGELWFLDFRVLPLEEKAKELTEQFGAIAGGDSERQPLLQAGGPGSQHGSMLYRYMEGSLWEGSVGNFYSPMESPEDSGDEVEEDTCVVVPRKFKRKTPLSEQEKEYKRRAEEALLQAWKLLNSEDGWEQEKLLDNGDEVVTKYKGSKKLFKLTGFVECPPKLLLEELYYGIESVPSWNPTLDECKTIQPIDSHCDVSYQVAAEAAGGVVSTRDFVNLRSWRRMDCGTFVCSGVSIKHPAMPEQNKRVRGENGPTCWAMHPVPGAPDRCRFQWLLDTDLKGWIPQYIIDSALSGAQLDYIKHIRRHAETLKASGRVSDHLEARLQEEGDACGAGGGEREKRVAAAKT